MFYFFDLLTKLKENRQIQFISASVKWNKYLDEYLKRLFVDWQYVFGSHFEAARYMNIGFYIITSKNDKLSKISDCLKNNIIGRHCVLITSTTEDHNKIYSYLSMSNPDIEIFLPGEIRSAKMFVSQHWEKPLSKNKYVLICNDDMLHDFYIDNADCLLHYDMPSTKDVFSIRFSVFQDSNTNFEEKNRNTYIFLNDENIVDLPKILQQMKLFGSGKVDSVLETQAKLISESLEKVKKNLLFCPNIQQFGKCQKPEACQNRHVLIKELDEPCHNIPKSGFAIIKILHVYDASHMSAKLMKFSNKNIEDFTSWLNIEDNSSNINSEMGLYYSSQSKRILHEAPKIGDKIAVEIESKDREQCIYDYYRGIVLEIIDSHTMNPKIKVKLIDKGIVKVVSKWRVFVLPSFLKALQTNVVDIILASVKPVDFDRTWCSKADVFVREHLKYIEDCQETLVVKIKLTLGTTVWIENLFRKYWHSKKKLFHHELVLPDLLIDKGFGDMNYEHIEKLVELCSLADINVLPNLKKKNLDIKREFGIKEYMAMYQLPSPQWAHLSDEVSLVSIDYVYSPKHFFVRNTKFHDRLELLQKKIDSFIEANQAIKLNYVVKDAICLAKNPDLEPNKYNRAKVTTIRNNKYVEVLFVDYGEYKDVKRSSLVSIHPNLISDLPFQIIECSLCGIKDLSNDQEEFNELTNYFYQLTEYPMYVKVVNTLERANDTEGKHYDVILYYEDLVVNLGFKHFFGDFCDDIQMDKVNSVIDDLYKETNNDMTLEEEYEFDESKFFNDLDEDSIDSQNKLVEEFGIAIFGENFKSSLRKIFQDKNVNNSLTIKEIITEEISSDNESPNTTKSIECINKSEIPGKNNNEEIIEKSKIKIKNNRSEYLQKYCLKCNTNTQSIVPTCIWYQDSCFIYLKFSILEIDSFSLNCSLESITLRIQSKDVVYNFKALLYGFIDKETVTSKQSYDGFHIKTEKLFKSVYKWPHLFLCNRPHKYLKYDPDHIEESRDHSTWIKVLNNYKLMALGKPLDSNAEDYESDYSSDEESFEEFEDRI
ncbi:putative ATP-dependent RNA helicase TDRD12 isoform X2 [Daktulosphaira vitifoliae]|nr:putative ATP-dependent RNA helicase TDRD12 isoform X2 [Daktulosphaira vitifoliae]